MRVLVTGHKGYIGTVMTPLLLKAGHEVVGYDSDLYRRCTYLQGGDIADVPMIEKDTRDLEVADLKGELDESNLKGFDAIIFLAALSNDPLGNLNPGMTFAINHEAPMRAATLGKKAGVKRFLFASSCSNYGSGAGDAVLDENAPLAPVTPYGAAKVKAEIELADLSDKTFAPVYLRPATAYGVSPRMRFDIVLNNLTAWAVTTGRIHLKSDGTPWRPIVHIEDISRAFLAALEAPMEAVNNEAFNVGQTEHNYRIRDLAEIVAGVVPGCTIDFADGAGPDTRNYRVNCDKIKRVLPAFKPQWDARKGAEQLYAAYRSGALSLDEFEGPRYQRIAHINKLVLEGILTSDLRTANKVATPAPA